MYIIHRYIWQLTALHLPGKIRDVYVVVYVRGNPSRSFRKQRAAQRSTSRWHSDPQPPRHPPPDLEEVWLRFGQDEAVSDEEVDEDEPAVGLELARVEGGQDFGDGEELAWVSAMLRDFPTRSRMDQDVEEL
jgi:hypothetical protein